MYHSITIGNKNTWDDWHLIPKSRPLVNPPGVKNNMVDIPGSHGMLDLSKAITSTPRFKNRTGSWEFIVENGFKPWAVLYSEIMNYLHGRSMKATLEDDVAYYYEGVFAVNEWRSDPHHSLIVIDYNLHPFKWSAVSTTDAWVWDTFDFTTGVINQCTDMDVNGERTVYIYGDHVEIYPVITVSAVMTVTYDGKTYSLSSGDNDAEFYLKPGDNELIFNGVGTVTVDYRGGSL